MAIITTTTATHPYVAIQVLINHLIHVNVQEQIIMYQLEFEIDS